MFRLASSRTAMVLATTASRYSCRAASSSATITGSIGRDRFWTGNDSSSDDVFTRSSSSDAAPPSGDGAFEKVAFLGTGKMAQAIIHPLINKGLQPAHKVSIFDVSINQMKAVQEKHNDIQLAQSIPDLIKDADLLICAVKPQNINEGLFKEFRKTPISEDATFLSVIAGVPLNAYFGTGYKKIVRTMPNTPAMIGRGMTVWCCTENITVNERDLIQKVLGCLGKAIFVDEEKYVDMSTSISGSGPAYIFMLMEAMIDAGVHMGFPRDKATTLVYHTLLGSTLYAMETGEHPAILRNNVTSPQGTTASALYELENGRFRTVIKDAMWACYRRSLEMGNHDSNVGPGRSHMNESNVIHQFLEDHEDLKLSIEKKEDDDDHRR